MLIACEVVAQLCQLSGMGPATRSLRIDDVATVTALSRARMRLDFMFLPVVHLHDALAGQVALTSLGSIARRNSSVFAFYETSFFMLHR